MKLDLKKPIRHKHFPAYSGYKFMGEYANPNGPNGIDTLIFGYTYGSNVYAYNCPKDRIDEVLENVPPEPRRKKIYIVWCPENQMVYATFCAPSNNNAEESANAYAERNNRNHIKLQVQEVELVEKV